MDLKDVSRYIRGVSAKRESGIVFLTYKLWITYKDILRCEGKESFLAEDVSGITSTYSNVPHTFACNSYFFDNEDDGKKGKDNESPVIDTPTFPRCIW